MSSITIQNNNAIRLISVNGEVFAHHPAKLKSFHYKIFSNELFLKIFEFTKEPRLFQNLLSFIQENVPSVENASDIINFFLECGFLEIVEQNAPAKHWQLNNWQEALQFHLHTNNLPKLMYNNKNGEREDIAIMETYVEAGTLPSNYKKHNGKHLRLEKPTVDSNYQVSNLFKISKSRLLNKELLSRLLYYAFGKIGVRSMRVTGAHVRKTVPSGGARHPIEAYLVIKNVAGVAKGLYHYDVQEHGLTLIRELPDHVIDQILKEKILLDENRPGFDIALGILYSCMYARSMFRYRESRSYRVMQYDLGHLTQNLHLLAKAYNLNFYSGYSCCEEQIEKLFDLDSYMESVIAYSVL